MRDFNYAQEIWAVIKADGTFAGVPCTSWEEARELSAQHEGSAIFYMDLDCDQVWGEEDGPGILEEDALRVDSFYHHDDDYLECGFDPYAGCYDYDC